MIHAQPVEETSLRRKNREAKKARSYDSGSSKGRLSIQYNPRFTKRFSNKFPSKLPKACDYCISNPKSQKGRDTTSPTKKKTCGKCGKKQYGDCLVWMDYRFGFGKSVHKVRDCPTFKGQDKLRVQAQDIGSNVYAQKRITFMLFALGVDKRVLTMW